MSTWILFCQSLHQQTEWRTTDNIEKEKNKIKRQSWSLFMWKNGVIIRLFVAICCLNAMALWEHGNDFRVKYLHYIASCKHHTWTSQNHSQLITHKSALPPAPMVEEIYEVKIALCVAARRSNSKCSAMLQFSWKWKIIIQIYISTSRLNVISCERIGNDCWIINCGTQLRVCWEFVSTWNSTTIFHFTVPLITRARIDSNRSDFSLGSRENAPCVPELSSQCL